MAHQDMKRFRRHPLRFYCSGRPYSQSGPLQIQLSVEALICLQPKSPKNRMKNRTQKLKFQLSLFGEASSTQREAFRKARTYLAKIAIVLHDAPDQMLMFPQLMEKIVALTSEDQKCIKNNIRVCLSSHSCFVKISVATDSKHRRTSWKLDCSQITAKMVRRHFSGLLQLFPELASKVGTECTRKPPEQHSDLQPPEPVACKAPQVRCQAKFSSPFSIESLLRRDDPPRVSSLCGVQIISAEQHHRRAEMKRAFSCSEVLLYPSPGGSSMCPAGGSRFVTDSPRRLHY